LYKLTNKNTVSMESSQ